LDWHQSVEDFWANSQDKDWLAVSPVGNISFMATVTIKAQTASCSEQTTVRICRNGIDDGMISLDESGDLTAEVFHTSYKPIGKASCRYRKARGSLLISGQSQKLGVYEVEITAIDA
jgi:hypothetical protein